MERILREGGGGEGLCSGISTIWGIWELGKTTENGQPRHRMGKCMRRGLVLLISVQHPSHLIVPSQEKKA